MHVSNYQKLYGAVTTLCTLDPLFSSSVSLKCVWAGFWLHWNTGAASVWKTMNPASWIRTLVLSFPKNLSLLLRFGYIPRCLTICHAVLFYNKLSLSSPLLDLIEVFTLQPFIRWNYISLKKVLNKANESYLSPNMTLIGVAESPALRHP